jgi:hypothetical protein
VVRPNRSTGYYKSDDPYQGIAAMVPYAVNWQIKERPFGADSEVRTDLKKLLTIIRLGGYRIRERETKQGPRGLLLDGGKG